MNQFICPYCGGINRALIRYVNMYKRGINPLGKHCGQCEQLVILQVKNLEFIPLKIQKGDPKKKLFKGKKKYLEKNESLYD